MIVESAKEVVLTLKLSQREAEWLKAYVQNPSDPDESMDDAKMRESYFNALTTAGVGKLTRW